METFGMVFIGLGAALYEGDGPLCMYFQRHIVADHLMVCFVLQSALWIYVLRIIKSIHPVSNECSGVWAGEGAIDEGEVRPEAREKT
jgi:hypothetical protein